MFLITLFTHIASQLVRIKFVANDSLTLTLDQLQSNDITVIPASIKRINELENYCGVASIRYVDTSVVELYYCGLKLCYGLEENRLTGCHKNEKNTKWELIDLNGENKMFKIDDHCITFSEEGRVKMNICNDANIMQMLKIEPYEKEVSFDKHGVNGDVENEMQLLRDEEAHRRESLRVQSR